MSEINPASMDSGSGSSPSVTDLDGSPGETVSMETGCHSEPAQSEDGHQGEEGTDLVDCFEKQLQQTMTMVEKMSAAQREDALFKLQSVLRQQPLAEIGTESDIEAKSDETIVRRGRGRPRKSPAVSPRIKGNVNHPSETAEGNQDQGTSMTTKRGRGRPRKSEENKSSATTQEVLQANSAVLCAEESTPPPKRGRGRPRKSQPEPELNDQKLPAQDNVKVTASISKYSGRMRMPSVKLVGNSEMEWSLHDPRQPQDSHSLLPASSAPLLSKPSPNRNMGECTTLDLRHFKTSQGYMYSANQICDARPNSKKVDPLQRECTSATENCLSDTSFDTKPTYCIISTSTEVAEITPADRSKSSETLGGAHGQSTDHQGVHVKTEHVTETCTQDQSQTTGAEIPATDNTDDPGESNVVDLRLVFKYEGRTIVAERGMSSLIVKEGVKSYRCSLCNKTSYARNNLMTHVRGHMGMKPFDCEICGKKFLTSSNKQRHVRETHEKLRPKNCHICGQGFFTQASVDKHKEKVHKEKVVKAPECTICGKVFKTNKVLQVHMTVHNSVKHKCEVCGKDFNFRTNYLRHMKIHSNTRPHACTQCDKRFIEARSLRLHVKTKHEGQTIVPKRDPSHRCDICDRDFYNQSTFENHMLSHNGLKPHSCMVCWKTFSLKANLKRHMGTHLQDKPFRCALCPKTLSSKVTLKYHMMNHRGEKPFVCTQCNKTFASPMSLREHMPSHHQRREFSCPDCDRTFLRRSHFQFHRASHTKKPGIVCEHCGAKFYRKTDWRRHLLKHTGEKPFHCTLCPRRFTRKHYLTAHVKSHAISCSRCDHKCTSTVALVAHMAKCHSQSVAGAVKPIVRIVTSTGTMSEEGVCPGGGVTYTMDLAKVLETSQVVIQEQHQQQDIQINIMDSNNQNQQIIIVPEVPVSGLPNALIVETVNNVTPSLIQATVAQTMTTRDTLHQAMSAIFDSEEEYVITMDKEDTELQTCENTAEEQGTSVQPQLPGNNLVQDVFYAANNHLSEVAVTTTELADATFDSSITMITHGEVIAAPDGMVLMATASEAVSVSMQSSEQHGFEVQPVVTMDTNKDTDATRAWTGLTPGGSQIVSVLGPQSDLSAQNKENEAVINTVNLNVNNTPESHDNLSTILTQTEQSVAQPQNSEDIIGQICTSEQEISNENIENSVHDSRMVDHSLSSDIVQQDMTAIDQSCIPLEQVVDTGQVVDGGVVESPGEDQYQELILPDGQTVRLLLNRPSTRNTQDNIQDQDSQYLLIMKE